MVPPEVTASRCAPGRPVSRAGHPVPHDPRPQLGELLARVPAGEQVEGGVEGRPRQRRERRRPADEREHVVDVEVVDGGHRDDLLGQHVERVGRHRQRLDRAGAHPLDGDRRLHQVGAVLGQHHPARHLADLVAGAADPLHAAGHRGRRLDLHDQVDGTHVDAELEAAGRDDARQPARLEVVLDQRPLLLADRAVVGAGQQVTGAARWPRTAPSPARESPRRRRGSSPARVGRDLVQPGGEALGQPARVGEDDRRPVLLDQVDDALLDVRPDRRGTRVAGSRPAPAAARRARASRPARVSTCCRARPCPRPARRPTGRAACRSAAARPGPGPRRRGSGPPRRSGAPSPTARSAARAPAAARRAAPATARGARRAWCRRPRAPRRR